MKEGIGLKRLPALLFVLILMTTVGCSAKEPTAVAINRSFCCPAAVEQNGLRYEAGLTVAPEQCAAVFSWPDAISGMTMTCRGDSVSVRFGQSERETALPKPKQCFLYWLSRALAQPQAAVNRKENTLVFHGTIDGHAYLLTIDQDSLLPLYFEMASPDLTVRFKHSE